MVRFFAQTDKPFRGLVLDGMGWGTTVGIVVSIPFGVVLAPGIVVWGLVIGFVVGGVAGLGAGLALHLVRRAGCPRGAAATTSVVAGLAAVYLLPLATVPVQWSAPQWWTNLPPARNPFGVVLAAVTFLPLLVDVVRRSGSRRRTEAAS